jgi:hypothetical protein
MLTGERARRYVGGGRAGATKEGQKLMVQCAKCKKELSGEKGGDRVASISGGIMGDEYIESYYFCKACGVYTIEVYHDVFCGEARVSAQGPVEKADGDAKVELIRQCSEPWNKRCRCPAHMEYFGGSLD